jgi:anti-anti-sigma factor
MEAHFYEEENHLIVVASGKLDTIHAPEFTQFLKEQLSTKPSSCLLDLTTVSFLSSSGLQSLLTGAKIAKKENFDFAVFGMKEMVADVFSMSGFDQFIKSYASKEDALAKS